MRTIYTIEQIIEAAAVAPACSSVHIYQNFVEPDQAKAVKVATWKAYDDQAGRNFGAGPDVFKKSTFGNFTALFKPGGEFLYFTNARPGNDQPEILNAMPSGYTVTGIDVNELLSRAVEREKKIAELEAEIEELKQELEEQKDNENKFQRAVFNTLDYFNRRANAIAPPAPNPKPYKPAPMQGPPNANMPTDQELENAIAVIIDAFGDDWIIRFAGHIASKPETVNQIKSFFP